MQRPRIHNSSCLAACALTSILPRKFFSLAGMFCAVISVCIPVHAEEITIIQNTSTTTTLGDMNCSASSYVTGQRINLGSIQNSMVDSPEGQCEICAGELWKYFRAQGIKKLDRLVLYVDVDDLDRDAVLSLDSLKVSILENGSLTSLRNEELISTLDRGGDHRLLIPGNETSSARPEARMEMPLGFDFMERFSENSTERLLVNVSYDGARFARPMISIEGRRQVFTSPNALILISFFLFWACVFWILKRLTLPKPLTDENEDAGQKKAPKDETSIAPAA